MRAKRYDNDMSKKLLDSQLSLPTKMQKKTKHKIIS